MSLSKVCEAADLKPGEMMSADVEGLPPLAIYNIEGEYYATSNICTHSIALLTDGYLDGETIECPLHGGAFNVKSGEPTHFPCEVALETFEVEVKDGGVYVNAP